MKTVEQVREKLEQYKYNRENCNHFSSEFNLSLGAIEALEWYLGEDNENRTEG